MIKVNFNFLPVGQGCFYTGNITLNKAHPIEFNFVYDCGTISKRSYLDNAITKYKTQLKGVIDLIVISHFDEDHVNGIVKLLKDIRCKKLIIPYYFPLERLILYGNTSNEDEEFREIITDPISFFSDRDRFEIDEIIVIGGTNESQVGEAVRPTPIEPLISEENRKEIEIQINQKKDEDFKSEVEKIENFKGNLSNVLFLRVPLKIKILPNIWEFIFYLREFKSKTKISAFEADINKLLQGKSIATLFDKTFKSAVRVLYRAHFNNVNFTSLCLYHGPLFNQTAYGQYLTYFENSNYQKLKSHLGTLLTGDIDLQRDDRLKHFTTYFANYLDRTNIFQVPHHGSKKNWNFDHLNGLESFVKYIINHGIGSKHPTTEVINDILANSKGKLFLNNETACFNYGFYTDSQWGYIKHLLLEVIRHNK